MAIYEIETEDGTIYEVETEDSPVSADLTPDAGFFETASMVPLKGISSIARGAAGLMEMTGDATGWDWLSQQGQQFSNEADVTDQKIRQVLGLEQDDTMNTVLNVGGEVAGALAPTGIGAKAKLGKLALASIPALFQSGTKYEMLQDKGASDTEAMLGAAASFPLNAALNRIDVGAAFRPFQNTGTGTLGQAYQFAAEAGKRALPVGLVGAATNVAGTLGDAFLDKNIAGQSQSEEEVLQNIAMSAITGGVTGAGMVPLGMRGGAPVDDATAILARMGEDSPTVPPPVDVPQQLALPAPDRQLALPAPDAPLGLPAPDAIVGNDFVARDPNYSWLPDQGPLKSSLPDATLIDGAPVSDGPPVLGFPRKSEDDGIFVPEQSMGPRSEAEIRDAINLREGATATQIEPIVDPTGAQVIPPPQPQAKQIYKPITAKGTLRQDLRPEERQVIEHIRGSQDYNAQKARAEAEAAIQLEQQQRAATTGPTNVEKRGIIITPETQSFPKPLDFSPPKPADDLVIDVKPKPGEAIELPYEPTALIDTDISSKGFARALAERQQRERAVTVNPDGTTKLSGEAGVAFNIFPSLEEVTGFLRWAKQSVLRPLNTLDNIAGRMKGSRPAGYQNTASTYNEYNDGLGGAWARNLEWMDTTAKQVPQARGFIQAGWEAPHDNAAMLWDANKTLDPYTRLQEKGNLNEALRAVRVATAQGKKFDYTLEGWARLGVTPDQARGAMAVKKTMQASNELNRAEVMADLQHKYNLKKAVIERRADRTFMNQLERIGALSKEDFDEIAQVLGSSDPKAFEAAAATVTDGLYNSALIKLDNNLKAKVAAENARFDAMKEANYVPFNRYGEHYAEVTMPDGSREWRQFETLRELSKFVNTAKKRGLTVNTGRLQATTVARTAGVPIELLAMLGDNSTGHPIDGWRKHLVEAKLVPGESVDVERAINEYLVGQARTLSIRRMQRNMEKELVSNLSAPELAPVVNKLLKWKESLQTPNGLQWLNKGFDFAFIGGNLRTPIADILGRIQLQYPLIAKYAGGLAPERHLFKSAAKEVAWYSGLIKPDSELGAAIEAAQRRNVIGTTIPREMFRRAQGGKGLRHTVHDWYFGLKALSERSTDLGGFITGWDIYPVAAKRLAAAGEAVPTRQEFAERFVRESKAVPSKGELPAIMNHDTVRLMSKYRLFQGKILKTYLEGAKDGQYGQVLRQVAATLLTSGIVGLPFVRDYVVASRAAGIEPEAEMREAGLGTPAIYGVASAVTGIDLSSSTGFGELLPGIGSGAADGMRKFAFGIAGAPAESIDKFLNYRSRGRDLLSLAALPLPQTASNLLKVADMAERGVQTISGDAVVPKDQVTLRMMLLKAAGLTDLDIKKGYYDKNLEMVAERRDNGHINQRIADAKFRGDKEEERALRAGAKADKVRVDENSVRNYLDSMRGKGKPTLKGPELQELKRKQALWD